MRLCSISHLKLATATTKSSAEGSSLSQVRWSPSDRTWKKGTFSNIIESIIPVQKSIEQLFFAPDGRETNCFGAFFNIHERRRELLFHAAVSAPNQMNLPSTYVHTLAMSTLPPHCTVQYSAKEPNIDFLGGDERRPKSPFALRSIQFRGRQRKTRTTSF